MRSNAIGHLCAVAILMVACGDGGDISNLNGNRVQGGQIDGGPHWIDDAAADGGVDSGAGDGGSTDAGSRPADGGVSDGVDAGEAAADAGGAAADAGYMDGGASAVGDAGDDASEPASTDAGDAATDAGDAAADAGEAATDAGDAATDAGDVDGGAPVVGDAGGDASEPAADAMVPGLSPVDALLGYYAMRTRTATRAQALGKNINGQATSYMLVDISKRDDGRLWWTQRLCRSDIQFQPDETSVQIADAVFQNAPLLESELMASVEGGVVKWQRTGSVALGFRDEDRTQPVPTKASDSRVFDQDRDGKPGITVKLRTKVVVWVSGETYNAQRTVSSITGTLEGTRLRGEEVSATVTEVLEATKPIFKISLTPSRDDAGDNSVLLVPISAAVSCEQVLAQSDDLFR